MDFPIMEDLHRSEKMLRVTVFLLLSFVMGTFQRVAGLEESLSRELDLTPFFHVLRPCNTSRQFAPLQDNCTQFYADANPSLRIVTIGRVNEFALPFRGNYTITVAGAAGGKGVCSRKAAGKGRLIAVTGVFIEALETVSVVIGQRGTSACETAPSHPACQLNKEDSDNFSAECSLMFSGMSLLFDGGGGGGGFSEFRSGQSIWTAGGGGGAAAFDGDGRLSDASSVLVISGSENGLGSVDVSAGVGGGAGAATSSFPQDGNFVARHGFRDEGGDDCLLMVNGTGIFPNTVGGFGGGGGGCGNGGGGGGFIGGSVVPFGNSSAGQGGISSVPSFDNIIQDKPNDDEDGFVSIFLDGCMCVHQCIPNFSQRTFRCACPINSTVSQNDLDCIISDALPDVTGNITESVLDTIGNVKTELIVLDGTVTLYSMEVQFEGVSTRTFSTELTAFSDTCMVVLIFGVSVVGFSEIIRIGGADTPEHSLLVSNISSSAAYTSVLDSPIQVSAIEIVGVDAECQAKVSWNTSIKTDPLPNSRTSIFQLSTLLPEFLTTCERSEACSSLDQVPSSIPPPLDAALLSGLLVGGVAAGGITLLLVLLVGCYIRYRVKKMHITLSDIQQPRPSQYQHYEMLPTESSSNMQPLLCRYEVVDSVYEFHYLNDQDEVHARLRQLQPKHGVRERAVAGSFSVETNGLQWSRKDFMFIRKLGTGRYGEIFLMQTKVKLNGVPVAVKTLQSDRSDDEQAFFREIDLMKTLHHPNIVTFLGFCEESSGDLAAPPLMVLEYMALGDLLNLLIANRPNPSEGTSLDEHLMCSFAADVARALLYLSEQSIVHGDVAARNVLVSQDLVAKLSDFRLSGERSYGDKHNIKLPVRWMAPEMLVEKSCPSVQTDVWAYGVLLWEMVTYGEYPYAQMEVSEIMKAASKGKLRLQCPADCPEIFTVAIDGCHMCEPSLRTSFQELLQMFEK